MDQYIAEEKRQSGGLRDILIILFKHKSKILLTFLATVISVTTGSFLWPPTYEAKSTLLVKFGREFIYRPEVGEKPSDSRSSIAINQEEIINSEIQIMTSRDLVEKVITTLEMENIYPDILKSPPRGITALEASVREFEKKLNVEGIKKSNVIEVSFQHKDPQMAAKAVNTLIGFFREKHLQVMSDPKSSFLEQQLSSYEQKLKSSENEMEAFRQKNKVYSLDEQRTLLLKQRMELDTAYKDSENRISELREKAGTLRRQMQNISKNEQHYTETDRYKVIDEIKAKLFNLQLQEQQLLNRYREDSTLVVNIRKEIKLAQDFLAQHEAEIKGKVKTGNLVYQELEKEASKAEADLNSQVARNAALKRQLSAVDVEIKDLDLRDKELQNLKRDHVTNEKNYQSYQNRHEEARISDELNQQKMTNINVIQAATAPEKPIKPKKLLNIVLGAILGILSGLCLAFFSEYSSQGFTTPEQAQERLGLPVLVTISDKK